MSFDTIHSRFRTRETNFNQFNYCCNGQLWCVRDCAGSFCVFFTYILIGYSVYIVMHIIVLPNPDWIPKICHTIGYNLIALLAIFSHLRAMLTDPGAVPIKEENNSNTNAIKCIKCGCIKPLLAHHCSVCHRCIRRMDHHCPWINNCVGEDNIKYFVLFNVYIACLSCYTFVLVILKLLEISYTTTKKIPPYSMQALIVLLILAFLEAVIFGIFTIAITVIQMTNICNDTTYIEKLKNNESSSQRQSKYQNCLNVFGSCCLKWFLPFTRQKQKRRDSEEA